MSKERPIRRSNQDVFFLSDQAHIQEPLERIFQRCTELFALAQRIFPETGMKRKKNYNVPSLGYSQAGHSFTFNFGFDDPRSIWIHGDRDYVIQGPYSRYLDKFFRYGFELPLTEEMMILVDRDRLTTHDPNFFVQRTDLGTFESGVSWSLKEEYREDVDVEDPKDPFSAPIPFLRDLSANINRPVTGINALVVNLENLHLLKEKHSLPLSDLLYTETRKVDK